MTGTLDDVANRDIGIAVEMYSIGNTNYMAALAKLETEVGASERGSSRAIHARRSSSSPMAFITRAWPHRTM